MHVQRPEVEVRCLPQCSPLCFLRQDLSLNLALVDSRILAGSPFSLPPVLASQAFTAVSFMEGGGVTDSHSDLYPCEVNTLLPEYVFRPQLLLVLKNMYLYSSLQNIQVKRPQFPGSHPTHWSLVCPHQQNQEIKTHNNPMSFPRNKLWGC